MLISCCFLFTWHQGVCFTQMSSWMKFLAQLVVCGGFGGFYFFSSFSLGKGRQRGLSWLTCRRLFPYLCSLPHTAQTAAWSQPGHSLFKLNRETGEGGRGLKKKTPATILWHPILIHCVRIVIVSAHVRNLAWAAWAGFGPSYLFQQKYPQSFTGLQILRKH